MCRKMHGVFMLQLLYIVNHEACHALGFLRHASITPCQLQTSMKLQTTQHKALQKAFCAGQWGLSIVLAAQANQLNMMCLFWRQ